MTAGYQLLSSEDAQAYQQELLSVLRTRNDSLSAQWAKDRARTRFALNTTAENYGQMALPDLEASLARDFRAAGQSLLHKLQQEVQ